MSASDHPAASKHGSSPAVQAAGPLGVIVTAVPTIRPILGLMDDDRPLRQRDVIRYPVQIDGVLVVHRRHRYLP
jgi:hypothetical protein